MPLESATWANGSTAPVADTNVPVMRPDDGDRCTNLGVSDNRFARAARQARAGFAAVTLKALPRFTNRTMPAASVRPAAPQETTRAPT
jgi:hypothetical protein